MNIKRFKQSQKFRVISGNASFYATAKEIRTGLGDFNKFNTAVQQCLDGLERLRASGGVFFAARGQAGVWEGIDVQLDVAGN